MSPKKATKNATQKSAKSTTAINKKSEGFTDEERAAMKERAQELKAAARGPRRASAFSSWARSFIAARSSSVNPLDFLRIAVALLADFCVPFFGLIETSSY